MSTVRVEFGFPRQTCACEKCCEPCRFIPGFLVPGDAERIYEHFGDESPFDVWAKHQFLASPGALVARNGQCFRIPTIVPAVKTDGACHWLSDDGRCSIHADAPFGCAFTKVCEFDPAIGVQVSTAGLIAIMKDWQASGPYSKLWTALWDSELRAEAPEKKRERWAMKQKG